MRRRQTPNKENSATFENSQLPQDWSHTRNNTTACPSRPYNMYYCIMLTSSVRLRACSFNVKYCVRGPRRYNTNFVRRDVRAGVHHRPRSTFRDLSYRKSHSVFFIFPAADCRCVIFLCTSATHMTHSVVRACFDDVVPRAYFVVQLSIVDRRRRSRAQRRSKHVSWRRLTVLENGHSLLFYG